MISRGGSSSRSSASLQGVMANQLSQTQCLASAATSLTPLSTYGQTTSSAGGGGAFQPLQSPPTSSLCYGSMSTSLMSNGNYPSLNATSPSTDSLFSVSTSLNSLPSECPPRRSDLDLKMETPDGECCLYGVFFHNRFVNMLVFLEMPEVYLFEGDEIDDFFDLEKHQKGRSASFGGSTAYSSQLAMARHGLFAPSLDTIGSVASGYASATVVFDYRSYFFLRFFMVPGLNDMYLRRSFQHDRYKVRFSKRYFRHNLSAITLLLTVLAGRVHSRPILMLSTCRPFCRVPAQGTFRAGCLLRGRGLHPSSLATNHRAPSIPLQREEGSAIHTTLQY